MPPNEQQHFNILVDGQTIPARQGQSVAAALLAAGERVFRRTKQGRPRGLFCGMGVCFECLVAVNGLAGQRACLTPVQPGMQVERTNEVVNGDD
jgi:predicted molibdopterin-dependent oxidoreductase YjgC